MGIKDAVVLRFNEILDNRGIKKNELAVMAGVTPSTVYSLMNPNRRDISIVTIKKLCDGLDISLADFFASDIFSTLEQEIY